MDWGLCRALHASDDVTAAAISVSGDGSDVKQTQVGDLIGTPRYMSPEQAQARNDDLEARSDQFALGLILQELVTLSAAYGGNSPLDVFSNVVDGKRRPVVHAYLGKRAIARDLVAIIDKACAFDREARYTNVSAFAADLRRHLRDQAVQARRETLRQRLARAISRNRQRVLTGILALVAVAATAIGLLLWQNQRQFEAQQLREQRLLQLRDAVDNVGNRVQTRMLQLEGAIESMAGAVAQSEEFGAPVQNRFYLLEDFRDPAKAPPDLTPSADLGGRISLSFPVWTLPPGMDRAAALPTIRKLAALQPFRRDLYRRVAVMVARRDGDLYTAGDADAASLGDASALTAIVIGLDNGIASRYPGWDGLPDTYDPRTRPWYINAKDKSGPQWGEPYVSAVTHRRELPLGVPLRDAEHRFFGVVSAQLAPEKLVRSLLEVSGEPAIRGVFLLDRSGHVLASSGALLAARDTAPDATDAALFPQPELLRRLAAHRAGIFEGRIEGHDAVFASTDVDPLGWAVVAVADPAILFAR